jgi:hypothetical protein
VRRDQLTRWIDRYEKAWRTPGTALLEDLFAPSASYSAAPFERPMRGLEAIAWFWEAERDGPDEPFELTREPVAVEGEVGVARVEVRYAGPPERVYRDLWIVRLDDQERCVEFEEWPFFPEQPRTSGHGAGGLNMSE